MTEAALRTLQEAADRARQAQELADVRATSARLSSDVQALTIKFDFAGYFVAAMGMLVGILGVIGWSQIKSSVQASIEKRIDTELFARMDAHLAERIGVLEQKAQVELLRIAEVLALHSQRAYDATLVAFGWDGSVPSLRSASPVVRRAVIDALYASQANRVSNREAAWTAVKELTTEDRSTETQRLFLKMALSSKRYKDGLEYWRTIESSCIDPEAILKASAILRHSGLTEEAISLAMRFRDESNNEWCVALAALLRDQGDFGAAHDILKPAVARILSSPDAKPPSGWHRVLNTFIANCVERGRTEDAVAAAQYVIRESPGAVEVFTVGKFLLDLPAAHVARTDLMAKFRGALAMLPAGQEATIRATVVLHRLENRDTQAAALLEAEVRRAEAAKHPRQLDIYFYRSTWGRVLREIGQCEPALNVLMPAASLRCGGEVPYEIALTHAQLGRGDEAARWLRSAGAELRRWIVLARDNPQLQHLPEVEVVLREFAQPRASEPTGGGRMEG